MPLWFDKLIQRFLARFLALIAAIYFEDIVVKGQENCGTEGPVILAGNHPNMLLDPVLVSLNSGIESGFAFWAKSTLFAGPAGKILRMIGAVPVHRHQDMVDPTKPVDNQKLFESSITSLEEGRALLLFPEGVSYTESRIQPLKTGAARVVQAYEQKYPDRKIAIVPCGLNYIAKARWRSHVLLEFGKPLYLVRSIEDERDQVRDLTHRLEIAILNLTLNAADMETLLDLRLSRQIYVDGRELSPEQHIALQRRFVQFYDQSQKNEQVVALRDQVREYRNKLSDLGIHDWQVLLAGESETGMANIQATIFRKFIVSLSLLPFAFFGFLLGAPAFLIGRYLSKLSKFEEERSTAKFVTITIIVPLQYFVIAALLLAFAPLLYFAIFVISTPIVAFLVINYVSRERQTLRSLFQLLWLSLLLRNSKRALKDLIERRKALKTAIGELASQFLTGRNEASILANAARSRDVSHSYDRDL